jgi:hypothetical protein
MKTELIILLRKLAFSILRRTGGEEKIFWLDMTSRNSRKAGNDLIDKIKRGKLIDRHKTIFAEYKGPGD